MKTAAVILLAGSSKRFAANSPKQFFEINGRPLAYYAIKPFIESKYIDFIVLTYKNEDSQKIDDLIASLHANKPVHKILGGNSRHDSVNNALNYLKDKLSKRDNILIHDGARLFLEEKQIISLLHSLESYNAATLAIPLEDTIAHVENGCINDVPLRSAYMKIQTPQAFKFETILKAHKCSSSEATDDTQLCLAINEKVKIVEGNKKLNKVTTIEDINNVKEILNG